MKIGYYTFYDSITKNTKDHLFVYIITTYQNSEAIIKQIQHLDEIGYVFEIDYDFVYSPSPYFYSEHFLRANNVLLPCHSYHKLIGRYTPSQISKTIMCTLMHQFLMYSSHIYDLPILVLEQNSRFFYNIKEKLDEIVKQKALMHTGLINLCTDSVNSTQSTTRQIQSALEVLHKTLHNFSDSARFLVSKNNIIFNNCFEICVKNERCTKGYIVYPELWHQAVHIFSNVFLPSDGILSVLTDYENKTFPRNRMIHLKPLANCVWYDRNCKSTRRFQDNIENPSPLYCHHILRNLQESYKTS